MLEFAVTLLVNVHYHLVLMDWETGMMKHYELTEIVEKLRKFVSR